MYFCVKLEWNSEPSGLVLTHPVWRWSSVWTRSCRDGAESWTFPRRRLRPGRFCRPSPTSCSPGQCCCPCPPSEEQRNKLTLFISAVLQVQEKLPQNNHRMKQKTEKYPSYLNSEGSERFFGRWDRGLGHIYWFSWLPLQDWAAVGAECWFSVLHLCWLGGGHRPQ